MAIEKIFKNSHSPHMTNIFIDSCAFDPKYEPEHEAAMALFKLYKENKILLEIAHSVQKEVEHPNTPQWVKAEARKMIYTMEVVLTEREVKVKNTIREILSGNGKVENILEDAEHIFEAQKYGGYFVTTDRRLLNKRLEISNLCSLIICKPSELIEIALQP